MNSVGITRAIQIWQVLISAAHNRQVLTYGIVADLIGVGQGRQRGLSRFVRTLGS
jgi:hypothetical protein